jgi:hypothetical protein
MKWLTFEIQRAPGFRFNLIDLGLITTLVLASWGLYQVVPFYYIHLAPLYVGFAFFLFCNVFRVGNRREPLWYLAFVAAAGWGLFHPERFWWVVLIVCEPVKIGLIVYTLFRPDYHGAFYRWVRARRAGNGRNHFKEM